MTDKYVLRLQSQAIRKLLERLRLSFNSKIEYKGKNYSWDTIIQLKSRELARFILEKNRKMNFSKPFVNLERLDTKELRKKILTLSVPDARKIGINKSTLWYLQRRAKSNKLFKINSKTKECVIE